MVVNTTWVSPVSGTLDKTTGSTIDETMTDAIASNFYHLGGAGGYIACRAYSSANQSTADTVVTAITLNTELFDSDPNGAMHDTGSNSERIVARTAGVYHCAASIRFAANATGYRSLYLLHSTGFVIAMATAPAATGAATDLSVAGAWQFAAGEYCYIQAQQNSGGALNVETYSTTPTLSMVKA